MAGPSEKFPEASTLVPYHEAPTGDVVASDAALLTLAQTRPWAMLCAVLLFVYAAAGGTLAFIWLAAAIARHRDPTFPLAQFVVIIPPNLIGAPLALLGGILALRYRAAARRAHAWRGLQDLDRVMLAQKNIWRWAGVTIIALFAVPLIIIATGFIIGVWR